MDALLDTVRDVGGRGARHGELDDDVGAGQVAQVVALVEATHEVQPLGSVDRLADLRAHPSCRSDDGHLDRVTHGRQRNHLPSNGQNRWRR